MTQGASAGLRRLAVVTNVPAPYREDFFVRLERGGVFRPRVFFCSRRRSPGAGAGAGAGIPPYDHEFVPGWAVRGASGASGAELFVPRGLRARLAAFDPDAIIAGGASLPALASAAYARSRGRRVYIWWAGTAVSERSRSVLHHVVRRRLFARVDGFLAYGREAADYLRGLGVGEGAVAVLGNNTRDAAAYGARVDAARAGPARGEAAPGGASRASGFALLCVGQLIARKNVGVLLEAWSGLELGVGSEAARLEIVGSGPLEARLRAQAAALGARGVVFTGPVAPEGMPAVYARADAVACPSLVDQWPQVVNEAMAAGLPVVVSRAAGVDEDFLPDGVAGLRVEPGDVRALRGALQRLLDDPALARRLGAAARESARRRDVGSAVGVIERVVAGAPGAAAAGARGASR